VSSEVSISSEDEEKREGENQNKMFKLKFHDQVSLSILRGIKIDHWEKLAMKNKLKRKEGAIKHWKTVNKFVGPVENLKRVTDMS
jgi:hypothetical protein